MIELWVFVALVIFLGLVYWKGWKPILAMLDKRSERIRQEIEEANALREEAQRTLAELKRRQRDAVGEAKDIVEHAKVEAERMRAHAEKDLEETLARRERQAIEKIEQLETKAVAEVRARAVDLAIAAAAGILEREIGPDKARQLIDQSIDEVSSKLH